MKRLALAFSLILLTGCILSAQLPPLEKGVSPTLAKWRAANYSGVRYKLDLTLEKGAALMNGEIEIRVKLSDEAAKNDLVLDWQTAQFQNDTNKPTLDVVKVNKSVVVKTPPTGVFDYATSKDHLLISKKYLKTGENVIRIEFAASIKNTAGAGVVRYIDKADGAEYFYSLFAANGASAIFPCFDQPDLKARFDFVLAVPLGWRAVSATKLSVNRDSKAKQLIYFFQETDSINPQTFAFAAGEFAVVAGKHTEFDNPPLIVGASPTGKLGQTILTEMTNGQRIYFRKSQTKTIEKYAADLLSSNRPKNSYALSNIILLPDLLADVIDVYENVKYINESSVIK